MKAETHLIGAIANDPIATLGIVAQAGVTSEWFTDIDWIAVWDYFEKNLGEPEKCQVFAMYDRFSDRIEHKIEDAMSVAIPAQVESYIKTLREAWQKRLVRQVGEELINAGDDPFELVSHKMVELHDAFVERSRLSVREVVNREIQTIQDTKEGKVIAGMKSCFDVVNDDWGGYQNGKLYVIGARPSVGKSTYLRQEANEFLRNEKRVGFCALEMDEGEIRRLMACNELFCNEYNLRNGAISQAIIDSWAIKMREQANLPLYINDDGGQSADSIRAWAIQKHAKEGIDVLIVDYLQQMSHSMKNGLREGVGITCNALRLLAKDLNIPVIVASQLNRASEEDASRPDLRHLKETGNIEADAYGCMLIHRKGKKGTLEHEFINAKNRGGKVGTLQLMRMETQSFTFIENTLATSYKG